MLESGPKSLTDEEWREYDIPGRPTPYRIDNPKSLYTGTTTHRIVDSDGVVHCVPTVGQLGTVLRWKTKLGANPVAF